MPNCSIMADITVRIVARLVRVIFDRLSITVEELDNLPSGCNPKRSGDAPEGIGQ